MTYANDVMAHYNGAGGELRQRLADVLAEAEAAQAAAPKPSAKSPQVPVSQSSWAKGKSDPAVRERAKASETARPDVVLAAAADSLALSEGISYVDAMDRALAEDPGLADRYAKRYVLGAERPEPPPIAPPRGYRVITRPADVEVAEKAEARRLADGCSLGEAMNLVLAEDEALTSRYFDYSSGHTALEELAERVEMISAAACGRERVTPTKAVSLALSEDPALKTAVFAHYERV